MTDLVKIYKKKPSLAIWTLFGIGILFFIYGTVLPTIDPAINFPVLIGEIFFGLGILSGAVILLRGRKR